MTQKKKKMMLARASSGPAPRRLLGITAVARSDLTSFIPLPPKAPGAAQCQRVRGAVGGRRRARGAGRAGAVRGGAGRRRGLT